MREKLVVADAAAVTDPRYAENVEALKSVQPADLTATEIDVRLGASWLPPGDVQEFTNKLLNIPSGVEIGHIHALGAWHISANWELMSVLKQWRKAALSNGKFWWVSLTQPAKLITVYQMQGSMKTKMMTMPQATSKARS